MSEQPQGPAPGPGRTARLKLLDVERLQLTQLSQGAVNTDRSRLRIEPAARHQADVRTLDVWGYLLLAAGPAALPARRRRPVAVLAAAFAATLGYSLLSYPGGPIWLALIVAFFTALITGHRRAAYGSLLAGYGSFLWLTALAAGRPGPSAGVRAAGSRRSRRNRGTDRASVPMIPTADIPHVVRDDGDVHP